MFPRLAVFSVNCRHEKVDNNWVQSFLKLENIKVYYWAMSMIFKGGGAVTCFHILGDIFYVGEAYMIFAQQQNNHIS